jgi:surfeit locus 1 family protein
VQAIAAARGLAAADVAPYFVDAEAAPTVPTPYSAATPAAASAAADAPAWPVAGLTVIAFPNSHLVYALTWYGLALMVLVAAWFVRRGENAAHADARPTQDARRD